MMFDAQPVSGPEVYAETQFSKPMSAYVRTAAAAGVRRPDFLKTYLVTGDEAKALAGGEVSAEPDKEAGLTITPPAAEYVAYRLLREVREKYNVEVPRRVYREMVASYNVAFLTAVPEGMCADNKISHNFQISASVKAVVASVVKVCRQSAGENGQAGFIIPDRTKYFNMKSALVVDPSTVNSDQRGDFLRVPLRNYSRQTMLWDI